MRTILALLFIVLFLIFSMPLLGITRLIRKKDPAKADRIAQSAIRWAFRCVAFFSGIKIHVIGEENIPTDHPVLFVGNHRSLFDIVVVYQLLKAPCGFVAKDSLGKIPLLKLWMQEIGCLFLDRKDLKQGMQTILTAIDMVKNGHSIFIFPEGTRSDGPDELPMLPFHEGSLRVSSKSGCPTIPVTMLNTQNIFEAHFPWVHKQEITVVFGEPIDPTALSREDKKHMGQYTADIIEGTIRSMKDLPA